LADGDRQPETTSSTGMAGDRDTIREAPAEEVSTTALSVDVPDSTLLSNPQPSVHDDARLDERLRELERSHDELRARVRLLEKHVHHPPVGRSALWLLFLPVVALLWWLSKLLGG
jgi:hypothetical protein